MQWCANFILSRIKIDQNAKRQIPSYFLIKAWFLLDLRGNHSSKFVKIMSHIEDFQHDLRPSWNRLQVGFNIKDMKFTNLFLLGVPIFICVKKPISISYHYFCLLSGKDSPNSRKWVFPQSRAMSGFFSFLIQIIVNCLAQIC